MDSDRSGGERQVRPPSWRVSIQEFMVFARRHAPAKPGTHSLSLSLSMRPEEQAPKQVLAAQLREEEQLFVIRTLETALQCYFSRRGLHCRNGWETFFQDCGADRCGRLSLEKFAQGLRQRLLPLPGIESQEDTARPVVRGVSLEELNTIWSLFQHKGLVSAKDWALGTYRLELQSWPEVVEPTLRSTVRSLKARADRVHQSPDNWYRVFCTATGDSSVSFADLKSAIRRALPGLGLSPRDLPTDRLRMLWRALDSSRTGLVSRGSFIAGPCIVLAAGLTDCKHGDWDADAQSCKCYEGWAKSSVTDTMNFLSGVCDQYQCFSDEKCESHLGSGTTCPVHGWNCYCGWSSALANGGHGFETEGKGGGACMGVMFTFSVWATQKCEAFMAYSWKIFLAAALICLPLGRKRVICDHHMPSMWRSLRLSSEVCHGECLAMDQYSYTMFKDDFAWSLYVLDLGLWAYIFLGVIWAVTLFIWSVVLWAMVILVFCGVLVAGIFASCCEGGNADCVGCNCACDCGGCGFPTVPSAAPGSIDFFYWGGPLGPAPGVDCNCCSGCNTYTCGSWRSCCLCCWPIAWLLLVFPRAPENCWGGLLGRLFGTHPLTAPERLYPGGNCVVEFFGMAWRRGADLHADEEWRTQVYNFLAGPEEAEVGRAQMSLVQDGELRPVMPLGRNSHAILINRPFDKVGDSCVESSYNDYAKNQCWICQDDTRTEFDLWLGCHHIFCSKCSTEMLKRHMPCPLCRVASTSVLRGQSCTQGKLAGGCAATSVVRRWRGGAQLCGEPHAAVPEQGQDHSQSKRCKAACPATARPLAVARSRALQEFEWLCGKTIRACGVFVFW
ncbi:unnamed protein product [Effrenium voratum]|uniref:RING-type domain-containing protein n=1 Tax=Effrenium voratum TaxID=2562239 RepID=A0AA36HN29_9DINO|nr:unnamed protein product [Effrenium voratum]